ncbi:MAG: Gfo/Idh/MocA family oxidoreductase [Planctomycetes bacterium]|nr:Gfo/Idh/MocA family oxidoreductase [Planctomycetota bacterium]
MNSPSIALIGARRAHQGLGPFVAKFLAQAGASIPAFLGTSQESNRLAAEELRSIAGLVCEGFTDLDELLRAHEVHALAILSPPETHAQYLEQALERGLHVLCEKPFVLEGRDGADGVEALLKGFREQGLLVRENCQWPRLLPAFEELFGAESLRAPKRFAMGLSPSSEGVNMGSDSLSHPLSLLQALDPGLARVCDVRVQGDGGPGPHTVHFRTLGPRLEMDCEVHLADSPERPRPAWFQFDSNRAQRLIRASDYAIFLGHADRLVPAPDPMESHLRGFVHDLALTLHGTPAPDTSPILHRARMLTDLLAAFPST